MTFSDLADLETPQRRNNIDMKKHAVDWLSSSPTPASVCPSPTDISLPDIGQSVASSPIGFSSSNDPGDTILGSSSSSPNSVSWNSSTLFPVTDQPELVSEPSSGVVAPLSVSRHSSRCNFPLCATNNKTIFSFGQAGPHICGFCALNLLADMHVMVQKDTPFVMENKREIRTYNNIFAFVSFGGDVDTSADTGQGPFVFRVKGHTYHDIGSLAPPGSTPKMH
ncbi:hypothetical protein POM88_013918 [Heracleum sosnowskyi]|uniref:Uncharacterized protein n=1 Tax=Heracleum sosnowskyi TaxID=360622 RepID=A0AAD8N3R4_9APIA|nr:hypothetical protein POM88_013918 [Heracleum sosnowskyi]